jgi:hypothetical protein
MWRGRRNPEDHTPSRKRNLTNPLPHMKIASVIPKVFFCGFACIFGLFVTMRLSASVRTAVDLLQIVHDDSRFQAGARSEHEI